MVDQNTQPGDVIKTVDDFRQSIIDNKAVIHSYDEQYKQEFNPDEEWIVCGAILAFEISQRGLSITLTNGKATLIWINPGTLHVTITPEYMKNDTQFSYISVDMPEYSDEPINFQENEDSIIAIIGDYRYVIDKVSLSIHCSKGEIIVRENALFSWQVDNQQSQLSVAMQADESSFGTGERAFELNLRGRILPIWNTDPGGYARGDDPVNACVPFYIGVHGKTSYGVLWDDTTRAVFDIGASDSNQLQITCDSNNIISCYFFAGDTVNEVLAHYTNITGRMHMPPLWAIGYHQSRYSYKNEEEVLTIARELRERNIPCDVIYLDIHYMEDYRVFTWNKKNFPDMKGLIEKLHAMNIQIVPILDPGIKVDEGYIGHDTGIEQSVFIKYPDGENVAGVVWPGLCYFPDFSSPFARDWWVEQLSDLLETGVDGIWNDMNEPLIFDYEAVPGNLPDYALHEKEGMGGKHKEIHNVYGTLMAKASLSALKKHRPGKRQFTFTRACTAGTQRYASSWTGDNHSTWDDLHIAITTTLQMGLSGIAFTGSDIGGFMKDATGELLTRWTQAGALMPFFRNHSAVDVIQQEPWRFGQVYEDAIREAIQLRYRLMPYMYTAFAQHAFYGMPIVRPIFMAEPNNPNIRDIDDSFMLGDNMLVAPILKSDALRRTVYLPDGDWYDFHTNKRYHGGKLISVEAPLDRIPIFVKSGTVLPMWDDLQHLTNPSIETLKMRVYTDSGKTVLYEDAGEGLDYREGEFRWLTFVAEERTDSLALRRSVEGDYTPSYKRIELQLVGSRSEITRIDVDGITHFAFDIRDNMPIIRVKAEFKEVKFMA